MKSLYAHLRVALGLDAPREVVSATAASLRAKAIRDYVAAHALEGQLSIGSTCDAVNASRATVYRAFNDFGGLHRFVQSARLRWAALALSTSMPERGLVRQIGERAGFDGPSEFSRAFARKFGFPPGEVLGLGRNAKQALEANGFHGDAASAVAPKTSLHSLFED